MNEKPKAIAFKTGANHYKQKHLGSALLPPTPPPLTNNQHTTQNSPLAPDKTVIYGPKVRQKAWKYFNRFPLVFT